MKMHDNRAIKQCCGKKEWSVKKKFPRNFPRSVPAESLLRMREQPGQSQGKDSTQLNSQKSRLTNQQWHQVSLL